uniref:Protein kinase domain-containing protein n=1 Tax=Leersia perrieri TaxID=77586 RepID=A0A0D9VSC9_9ORYZ
MENRAAGGGGVRRVGEYVLLRQIGAGTYAQVWFGRHCTRGTEVALKEIPLGRLSRKLRESLLSEVDILRRIRHPNVIALHESIRDGGTIYLVLEYCRGGDLHSYLQKHKRVSETVAKHFIQQLASGLQMLRENNVVHRDLKPQNILLVANNENSLLKIADFGFAKFLEPSTLAETLCGSPLYMAPEVMQAQKYDAKLLSNILNTREIRFPSDCNLSHGCIDLCRKLLRINSVERLTVEEFVNHPFLTEHAPERTLSRTPSDIRDGFPFINSSPTRLSSQSSQEDCMPFPLDDEPTGQDENPVTESKSAIKPYGFATSRKLDKISGQSPSKHASPVSKYIRENISSPSSQHLDHPRRIKEKKSDEGHNPKGGYPEDSPIIDSLEFVDQEYVFVSGPHPEGSSSMNDSRQRSMPSKFDNSSFSPPKLTAVSAPRPIHGAAINRQLSGGTGSLDSHCSPVSGTSQGSTDLNDAMDQPPSDCLTRIRLLEQYASTITELVKEKIKDAKHLEAFSIQLVVLATWKQAIYICTSYASSATDAPHLLVNSQLIGDTYIEIERQFLVQMEYAEELASTIGQAVDATEMPDAIEIIFQTALHLGRHGGVDEMMGKSASATVLYSKALEEIRQKRAAERMQQQQQAAAYADPYGWCISLSVPGTVRRDPSLVCFALVLIVGLTTVVFCREPRSRSRGLPPFPLYRIVGINIDAWNVQLGRVRELENGNRELERENQMLLSKVFCPQFSIVVVQLGKDKLVFNTHSFFQIAEKEVEKDSLVNRLNDLERNVVPSLKKAMNDISLEKDAAVVAKEDALAQLRNMKKRLKEAEEEQYRAEEDSASLRAQLNTLQQQAMTNSYSAFPVGASNEQILAMEKEIEDLQAHIKQESFLRQQEQQKLSEESLLRQQEQHKLCEEQSRAATLSAEKKELEDKIAALTKKASDEASELAAQKAFSMEDREKLESQLHDMALMVERLEGSRQKLLMEIDSQSSEIEKLFEENSALSTSYQDAVAVTMQWENQDQLIKEQSRSEGLSAEIMKLSAELRKAVQAQNNLTRIYRPVLRDIESNLMKMKQETYATIQ